MTYILLASDISGKWDWDGGGRGAASASDDVRELLALIPSFRLLVAHGYSDMVTPYAASRYVLDHLPPIGDPSRAQLQLYRGGHMFYIDAESRKAFSADARSVLSVAAMTRRCVAIRRRHGAFPVNNRKKTGRRVVYERRAQLCMAPRSTAGAADPPGAVPTHLSNSQASEICPNRTVRLPLNSRTSKPTWRSTM